MLITVCFPPKHNTDLGSLYLRAAAENSFEKCGLSEWKASNCVLVRAVVSGHDAYCQLRIQLLDPKSTYLEL